jgi:hypothetical protein
MHRSCRPSGWPSSSPRSPASATSRPAAAPATPWSPPSTTPRGGGLLVARRGRGFGDEEADLVRAMGRVVALTVSRLQTRQLLERLSKIQRSISTQLPLDQVLEAIVTGAGDLLGEEVAGPAAGRPRRPFLDRPGRGHRRGRRAVLGHPAQPGGQRGRGRAIVEDRLVVTHDYGRAPAPSPSSRPGARGRPWPPRCTRTARWPAAWGSPPTTPGAPSAAPSRRCCWPSPSTPAWP